MRKSRSTAGCVMSEKARPLLLGHGPAAAAWQRRACDSARMRDAFANDGARAVTAVPAPGSSEQAARVTARAAARPHWRRRVLMTRRARSWSVGMSATRWPRRGCRRSSRRGILDGTLVALVGGEDGREQPFQGAVVGVGHLVVDVGRRGGRRRGVLRGLFGICFMAPT